MRLFWRRRRRILLISRLSSLSSNLFASDFSTQKGRTEMHFFLLGTARERENWTLRFMRLLRHSLLRLDIRPRRMAQFHAVRLAGMGEKQRRTVP